MVPEWRQVGAGCAWASQALHVSLKLRDVFMNPFVWLILAILDIYKWILIATIVLSWLLAFNIVNQQNPVVRQLSYALRRLTEPVLAPVRRILPDLGGLDISPLVIFVAIQFLQYFVTYYAALYL
jgi:YggT family protein